MFMLIGTLVLLPLVLAHTAYVYWLFRGKIGPGETYH
jgi:cytochrome d ubiquinol oxidase subunit II